MNSRFARTLLVALLASAPMPFAAVDAQSTAAQTVSVPKHSVMAVRLSGRWESTSHLLHFDPATDGRLNFRWVDRQTGRQLIGGVLRPEVLDGVMRGDMRFTWADRPEFTREMRFWVTDAGELVMTGFNELYDNRPFAVNRVGGSEPTEWTGKWRTSRGLLEIKREGTTYVAFLTGEEGARKDRIAFRGEKKVATGAWDTEYGLIQIGDKKISQWGDLGLTISADGNSFTGWYTTPKNPFSYLRKEWTGERADGRPGTGGPQQGQDQEQQQQQQQQQVQEAADAVSHWPGVYLSSQGSRVTLRRDGTSYRGTGVGTDRRTAEIFTLAPQGGEMRGLMSGSRGNVAISAPLSRLGSPIRATLATGGTTIPYTLCKIEPDDVLVHSAQGRWARLGGTSLQKESDGSSTLTVRLLVLNAGAPFSAEPSSFSARLPQHASSRPATRYYDQFGQEERGYRPPLATCQLSDITLKFSNVTSAITKLVVRDGIDDTAQFDISAATADIGRTASTAPPPPASQPPVAQSPISQPAGNSPAGQVASTAYKPLNRIDVRVDRVVVARGYPNYQVHAFLTVKNTSASPQYFTSGFMKAVIADADGVSWERSQPYRASGEPAALFSSTPVIQPGGELKVRYVFLPEADARLTSLTLSEGGQRAEFPVGL